MINHLLFLLSLCEQYFWSHMELCDRVLGENAYPIISGGQRLLQIQYRVDYDRWNAQLKAFWYRRISLRQLQHMWAFVDAHMPEGWQEEALSIFNS